MQCFAMNKLSDEQPTELLGLSLPIYPRHLQDPIKEANSPNFLQGTSQLKRRRMTRTC